MVYRPIKKIPNSSDHIVRLNHLDMTSVEMGGRWQKGLAPAHIFPLKKPAVCSQTVNYSPRTWYSRRL